MAISLTLTLYTEFFLLEKYVTFHGKPLKNKMPHLNLSHSKNNFHLFSSFSNFNYVGLSHVISLLWQCQGIELNVCRIVWFI